VSPLQTVVSTSSNLEEFPWICLSWRTM
jgi:hypothetical protein